MDYKIGNKNKSKFENKNNRFSKKLVCKKKKPLKILKKRRYYADSLIKNEKNGIFIYLI